jgi:hypothetical protein
LTRSSERLEEVLVELVQSHHGLGLDGHAVPEHQLGEALEKEW